MGLTQAARRLRTTAWLGWQIDSNWTDPFLFLVYAVARPLSTALILVGMYWAVRGQAVHTELFAGFYVANAFHAYVNTVLIDMGWIVFGDREEYEMLKYLVVSPIGMLPYLAGRSGIKFLRATFSASLILLLGWFALGVRWEWAHVQWAALVVTILLGLLATLFAGFLVAGSAMVLTRAAIPVLEGVSLGLFLLCGVIFPIDLLPGPLRAIALLLPFTWWYEAIRRFLFGHGTSAFLSRLSDAQLLGGLAAITFVLCIAAVAGFRAFESRARQTGCLDQTTFY